LTPPKPARDEIRPNRVTLLIASAVALLCAGAAAASAQTVAPPPDEEGTTTTTEEQPTAEPSDGSGEAPATQIDEEPGSGDAATGSGEETGEGTKQRRAMRLELENTKPRHIYFYGKREARFAYKYTGAQSADLRIEVVKKKTGDVVKTIKKDNVPSGEKQRVSWNGKEDGGGYFRKGRFFFRVETQDGAALARKRADGKREFEIHPAIFPVRGRHQYWDGYGAGRGHQGQDVGANCGTKLVAAEPGKVALKAYDGGGYGYYVIINVRGQRRADVYGHLQRKASVRQGQRVKTGEVLGRVGATGNASGCHLHFEVWEGAYYRGGAPVDPMPYLAAWKRSSKRAAIRQSR
jgi:murein DD-endopeptidase MepM/ murein hydrolase activator NlpD